MNEKNFGNKSGPLPKDQRDAIKEIFLEKLAETNKVTAASRAAGISRVSGWAWINSGYVTEQELTECRMAFEEFVRRMVYTGWWVKHGRACSPTKDPFESASTRHLWALAKAGLPEYQGKVLYEVRYSTRGWTPQEKAEVFYHIREIQARHRP